MLLRAADCAVVTGDPRRAVDLAEGALVALAGSADRDRILHIENRLRWYLWWAGERAAAAEAVERALETIPAAPPSVARARALAQHAGILMTAGEYDRSQAYARDAIEMGRTLGRPEETALAYGVLGWDLALLGDVDAGIKVFEQGRAIGEAIGSIEGIAIAVTNLPALLDRVGRSEEALRAARDGYRVVERLGIARTYGGRLLGYAAKSELALGRWDEADRTTALGLRRGAVDAAAVWLQVNRARLLTGRGRFDEARVLLRRAWATDERLGGTEFRTALLAAEAELAVWEGRTGDVIALGARGLATLQEVSGPDPSLAWLAALVLRAVADVPREALDPGAAGLVERIRSAVTFAETQPGFVAGPRASALVALLHAEEGRAAGRSTPEVWDDVADRWAAMGRPYPEAYARFREGEARLATRGSRALAAEALGRASATAQQLGAAPLGELVATLARQARIPLADAQPAAAPDDRDPYGFTPREGEVLRLVAGGWTNQQIAEALFITRKTASVHVSNILGKLGVENRGEAAALAHRLGLVEEAPLPGNRR
jgi:DNA-binding CsgD family transcriptional regulator/tetratricopeptide (TPR) repeat protein